MPTLNLTDSRGINFRYRNGVLTIDATHLTGGVWLYAQTDQDGNFTEDWRYLQKNTKSVVVKGNITEMPYPVFQEFEKLTNLCLPASLEEIGDFDFSGCKKLTKITLPAKTQICGPENNYFHSIEVEDGNPYYTSINGCLMSKDGKRLIVAPGGLDELIIPDGCEEIDRNSIFMSYNRIVVPASVSSIDSSNFKGEYGTIVLGDYTNQYKLINNCFPRETRMDGTKEEHMERFKRIIFMNAVTYTPTITTPHN